MRRRAVIAAAFADAAQRPSETVTGTDEGRQGCLDRWVKAWTAPAVGT